MIAKAGRRALGYFTSSGVWTMPGERVPPEVVFLRVLGFGYLGLTIVGTATVRPRPAVTGDGLAVLVALCVLCLAIVVASPKSSIGPRARLIWLAALVVAATVLAAVQPNGIWEITPYYVGIVAAMRLDRRIAIWALGCSILPLGIVASFDNHWGA